MFETGKDDFKLKFEMVDLRLTDSVQKLLSLRGKEIEQRGAEESAAKGSGEHSVSHRGERHTQVISAMEHMSCVHVYEVVGAIKLEGVGAERHFETTILKS